MPAATVLAFETVTRHAIALQGGMLLPLFVMSASAGLFLVVLMMLFMRRHIGRALLALLFVGMVAGPAFLLLARSARGPSYTVSLAHVPRVAAQGANKVRMQLHEGLASARDVAREGIESSMAQVAEVKQEVENKWPGLAAGVWPRRILSFGAIGVFLFLVYLFFDSSTRGHFTWPLRILALAAFVGLCLTVVAIQSPH